MRTVDRDLDRVVTHLRHRIRERGYTQLEVQEVLGWGRSYISQLLTRQKSLRLDQILQILNVINLDPAEFWAEVFQFGQFSDVRPGRQGRREGRAVPTPETDTTMLDDLRRIRALLDAVVSVLAGKNLLTTGELDAAAERLRQTTP